MTRKKMRKRELDRLGPRTPVRAWKTYDDVPLLVHVDSQLQERALRVRLAAGADLAAAIGAVAEMGREQLLLQHGPVDWEEVGLGLGAGARCCEMRYHQLESEKVFA